MYDSLVGQQIDYAFYYIAGFSLFFLVAITVTMIYFVWRYDAKRHPVAVEIPGNVWLELLWTIVPGLIALSMFYVGWQSYISLRTVPSGAIPVKVEAQMFSWEFEYPGEKISKEELVVPVGKPIKIELTSKDVVHSLFIPAFRIKIDATPRMTTYAWFQPEKIGNYDIFCAEFCGNGHADMRAVLRVVSEEDYQAWVKKKPAEKENEDEDHR